MMGRRGDHLFLIFQGETSHSNNGGSGSFAMSDDAGVKFEAWRSEAKVNEFKTAALFSVDIEKLGVLIQWHKNWSQLTEHFLHESSIILQSYSGKTKRLGGSYYTKATFKQLLFCNVDWRINLNINHSTETCWKMCFSRIFEFFGSVLVTLLCTAHSEDPTELEQSSPRRAADLFFFFFLPQVGGRGWQTQTTKGLFQPSCQRAKMNMWLRKTLRPPPSDSCGAAQHRLIDIHVFFPPIKRWLKK